MRMSMKQSEPFLPHWFKYIDTTSKRQVGANLFKDGPFYKYENKAINKGNQSIVIFLDGVFYPTTTGASYHFMNLLTSLSKTELNVYLFRCYRGWEDPNIYKELPFNTVCISPDVFYDDLNLLVDVLQKYSISTLVFDTSEVVLIQGAHLKEALGLKIIHDIQNVDHVLSTMAGLPSDVIDKQKQDLVDADKFVDLYWAKTVEDNNQLERVSIKSQKIKVRYPIIDTMKINYVLRTKLGSPVNAIFLGNMSYSPNIGGLEILENTYRDCSNRNIDLKIDVVGEGDLQMLKGKYPHLNFRGKVDLIDNLFSDYNLAFACPSFGSGISLKVLDYMAAGLPIIANDAGIRGHPNTIREHVLTDNGKSLCSSIQKLFSDPGQYKRLSLSSLTYVNEHFNPDKNVQLLIEDIKKLNFDLPTNI